MNEERRRTRRRFLQASGLVAAGGLAGCSFQAGPVDIEIGGGGGDGTGTPGPGDAPGDTETDTPRGPTGGTLELVGASVTTLDPVAASDDQSEAVVENLYDGLTTFENGGVEVRNQLAESVSVSSDHRTYTVTLGDATFHDGRPVTAQDVVYSWERLAASDHSRNAYLLLEVLGVDHRTTTNDRGNEVYKPGTMEVTAEDDRTLRMELLEPNHAALAVLALPAFSVVPEGIVGDVAGYPGEKDYDEFATEDPVGAGPFVLDDWRSGDELALARFEDYHGPTALLDGLHWTVTTDSDTAYTYGQDGDADLITVPDDEWDPTLVTLDRTDDRGRRFGQYGPMDNGETVDYLGVPGLSTYFVGFNADFVGKPIRQAFAYALDQHETASRIFEDRTVPAYNLTPPAIFPDRDYDGHAAQYPYGHDEAKLAHARQIMEDAGYGPANRAEFTVSTFESTAWEETLEVVRDKLASAHVDMTVDRLPFGTLYYEASRGNLEAYASGYSPYAPTPDELFEQLDPPNTDTSGDGADGIAVNWRGTDAADDAESAYRTIEDNQGPTAAARAAREQAYLDMEAANWEDVVVLPVVHGMEERFAYEWANVPPFGALGSNRQQYNTTSLGERDA